MRNGLIIHNLGRQFVTVYVIQRGLMIVFSADRLKVQKETKLYISLMLEDEKLSKHSYVQCNFLVIANKDRNNRVWERPMD